MALNINGTTGISGVDGSISAPALTGTDSNTGITFPAADTIKFATGGVERMSITNSGITGAGKVLQVVESSAISSQVTVSSTTFADSGVTVSITPSATTSKILVLAVGSSYIQGTGYNVKGEIRVLRDSTEISRTDHGYDSGNSSFGARLALSFNMSRLDTPSTTSSITYKIQIRVAGTNYSPLIQIPSLFNNQDGQKLGGSRIQLLEIGA